MDVKICGIRDKTALTAALNGGARYVGFVFADASPRRITPDIARELSMMMRTGTRSVGLFVNPDAAMLRAVLPYAMLDMIQLHGDETPADVAAVKTLTRLPVIKAVGIGSGADLRKARDYEGVCDMILLDAKPAAPRAKPLNPQETAEQERDLRADLGVHGADVLADVLAEGHSFGGAGVAFDWTVLRDFACARPWMLAGGLDVDNVAQAVAHCNASCRPVAVDVSSGVEQSRGVKDPAKIKAFLDRARAV